MVSNSNANAVYGFLGFFIFCRYCSNNAFAFVPQNALVIPQQQRTSSLLGNKVGTSSRTTINSIAMGKSSTDGGGNAADPTASTIIEGPEVRKSRLVWLTGFEDLRVHDHGGFTDAFSKAAASTSNKNTNNNNDLIIPVFVIDPKMHLRSRSTSSLKRLHESLTALEKEILSLPSSSSSLMSPLVVRTGSSSSVLPALAQETNAIVCHVVADDVVSSMRTAQRSTCESLAEMSVDVHRWANCLRSPAPWSSA